MGIDAPETAKGRKPGQPWGKEATWELVSMVQFQAVEVELMGSRTYGREVARLWIGNRDINLEWEFRKLGRVGYQRMFIRFSPDH